MGKDISACYFLDVSHLWLLFCSTDHLIAQKTSLHAADSRNILHCGED